MPGESPEESLETEVVPKKQRLRHRNRNRMTLIDVDVFVRFLGPMMVVSVDFSCVDLCICIYI